MSNPTGSSDEQLASDLSSLEGVQLSQEFRSTLSAAISEAREERDQGKVIPFNGSQMDKIESRTGTGIRIPRWATAAAVAVMGGLTALIFTQDSVPAADNAVMTAGIGSVEAGGSSDELPTTGSALYNVSGGDVSSWGELPSHKYTLDYADKLRLQDEQNREFIIRLPQADKN